MLHLWAVVLLCCVSAVAKAASDPYSEYEERLDKFVIDTIGLAECSVYTELLRKANYTMRSFFDKQFSIYVFPKNTVCLELRCSGEKY
jgi:hypothetical protein